MAHLNPPQEIEIALLVLSPQPAAILEDIAALRDLERYQLIVQPTQPLEDIYFDTPDLALSARRLSLRLRRVAAQQWLTLKGAAQRMEWGGTQRSEIEVAWSYDGLRTIGDALRADGIPLATSLASLDQLAPLPALRRLGFEVVQHRETLRQIRAIIPPQSDMPQAELALDALTYHLPDGDVRCYEVEVEFKGDGDARWLQLFVAHLKARYGATVRPWPYGKLATGKEIERWLHIHGRDSWLDAGGNPTPDAWERLEASLRAR